jgi:hypothetical protein
VVKTILYILNPEKYFEGIVRIFKAGMGEAHIIYVTTNKPNSHIVNLFRLEGLNSDRIFFVDCISKEIMPEISEEPENCLFVEGPQDITGISLAIHNGIEHLPGEKLLFLDSLSTLLLYNDANVVGRFSNFIINKLRVKGVSGVILALESDVGKDVLKNVESFVDEVIKHVE